METQEMNYTYNDERECLKCFKPIPDQAHGSTKFCERVELPDGSIESCKDDFHAERNKEKNIPYQKLIHHHKYTRDILEKLALKNELITAKELDVHGIDLTKPVQIKVGKGFLKSIYFIDFYLSQINSSTFKIIKHDNEF